MTNRMMCDVLWFEGCFGVLRRSALVALILMMFAVTPAFTQATVPYRCPPPFQEIQRTLTEPQRQRFKSGDLDADGIADIMFFGSAALMWHRGLPGGGYADAVPIGPRAEDFVLVDVNGDGFLDVIHADGGRFTTALGDGEGTLTESFVQPAGWDRPNDILVARVGGPNANFDVLILDSHGGLYLFEGFGDGTFAPSATPLVEVALEGSPIVSDLDGDGFDDIALIDRGAEGIAVLHNRGDRSFELKLVPAPEASMVMAGDVDGDGLVDLVYGIRAASVQVVRNLGDMQFDTPVRVEGFELPGYVVVADVNGDGILDIVAEDFWELTMVIALGEGDGTFPIVRSVAAPIPVSALIAATAGARKIVTAIGHNSGEIVTWRVNCVRRRAARH